MDRPERSPSLLKASQVSPLDGPPSGARTRRFKKKNEAVFKEHGLSYEACEAKMKLLTLSSLAGAGTELPLSAVRRGAARWSTVACPVVLPFFLSQAPPLWASVPLKLDGPP